MSDDQKERITWGLDLAYKISVPIALAALFFLKSSFATRPELDAIADRISGVETAIKVMVEQSKTNERQDTRIEDIEHRLRVIELRRQ